MDQNRIPLAELPPGTSRALCIAGQPVLLVNDDGKLHAIASECSHAYQSLETGRVMNGWIACPAHGARFDLASGEPLNPPATAPLKTYAVRVEGDLVFVEI